MPKQDWSPEPWHIGETTCMGGGYNYISILSGDRFVIPKIRMRDADAARIVACVNACCGIPTWWLQENGEIRGWLEWSLWEEDSRCR